MQIKYSGVFALLFLPLSLLAQSSRTVTSSTAAQLPPEPGPPSSITANWESGGRTPTSPKNCSWGTIKFRSSIRHFTTTS